MASVKLSTAPKTECHICGKENSAPECRECQELRAELGIAKRAAAEGAVPPPRECGDRMLDYAPARRPLEPVKSIEMRRTEKGNIREVNAGFRTWRAARERDVFDDMVAAIKKAMRDDDDVWLTDMMISAGRNYRDLFTAVQSAGIKVSADLSSAQGGGDTDFMDRYIRDVRRLRMFQAALVASPVLEVKRKPRRVPVSNGVLAKADRQIITVRALVDQVCIAEKPLTRVLEEHGWIANGKNRKTLGLALAAALERMQGI